MKRIVVYRIAFGMGAWILASTLCAQKPAIDLITSNQQYRHPEAIIDTGFTVSPPAADSLLIQDRSAREHETKGKVRKNRHRQIGPSLDSLFQNRESQEKSKKETPEKHASFRKKYNPIYLILTIIALK